ncbi:YbcC family protein [Azohydromonas aeria]|uniref:YbcC family protein n=1 Tax=Azohydromonas aeria TaxID=2590212 RepID=UPI0012F95F89|nr:DUF2309 domain-containing protein [Azohydromonas aeria]
MEHQSHSEVQQADALAGHVAAACARIAPTWPLDQFIAVNPFLGWSDLPMPRAAAELGVLCGTRLTMQRRWYREQFMQRRFGTEHLEAVAARGDAGFTAAQLAAALDDTAAPVERVALMSDLCDTGEPPPGGLTWTELLTHQLGQHCAAFFDAGQARWRLDAAEEGLYASWRRALAADRGIPWRQGRRAVAARLRALPADARTLIAEALAALGLPEAGRTAYLTALLLNVNGWAAWCAGLRWRARLAGAVDDHVEQLLALRLAWEWLLHEDALGGVPCLAWAAGWADVREHVERQATAARIDWALQEALELAQQRRLGALLLSAPPRCEMAPLVQAVFCIDVRSEPLRRAFESLSPALHTRGFAGFFGLPIAYQPVGSALVRPQLPGLLAPAHVVSEADEPAPLAQAWRRHRQSVLAGQRRWDELRAAPASGFSFVEACGLLYGARLLADSLPSTAAAERWEDTGLPREARGRLPRLALADRDPGAAAGLAAGILRAMGLTRDFAPLVLLVGHGSQSANNAHAAGLDCGACGGHAGEVNARVLAALLNAPAVRQALREQYAIDIPAETHVLPALHNTTTEDVVLFDTEALPEARQGVLPALRHWLAQAGHQVRAERAAALGLQALADKPEALAQAMRRRANDWSQPRPEWGLAGNAALIVAPRERSRGLHLGGRCFLHDYDPDQDADGTTLALIMTAPMVVAGWINLQYYASTVDNRRWGSGNKTLHNVVGGGIGVFEGNGGDLRIGLPLQSLQDAQGLRHEPLRLAVFIEAPRGRIEAVLADHAGVRDLVSHGWLHLLRLDPEARCVEQWCRGEWIAVS